jgi:holo-[acyl-carrier protein] synthase
MALRVGIDLVAVEDVRASLDAHGERYLERIYTEREVADCGPPGSPDPERLAARLAAKEATFKVLRVGSRAMSWREAELIRGVDGEIELALGPDATALAREAGIADLAVSITHDNGRAVAVVVGEI